MIKRAVRVLNILIFFAISVLVAPRAFAQLGRMTTPPTIAANSREALAARANQSCTSTTTSTAPFYVTDNSSGTRNFAPVSRSEDRPEVIGYIPKNSVVKMVSPEALINLNILGTDFVDVQVLETPTSRTDENANRSPVEIRAATVGAGTRATAGFRGAIQRRYLKPAGDTNFIVQRDAPALQIPGGELAVAGKPMRLSTVANIGSPLYRVNRCCPARPRQGGGMPSVGELAQNARQALNNATNTLGPGCHDNYIFEIMNPQLTCIERTLELAAPNCDAFSGNLRPVSNNQFEAVYTLSRITGRGPESTEFIDTAGLYKLPKDPATGLRPFNGLNAWRNPSSERSPANDQNLNYDSFMDPMAACTYMRVLQAWQQMCQGPGCQIQDNDAYHPPSWNGHASHGKKTCIDIFPISRTTRGPGSVSVGQANYDQARTMQLIQLLIDAGAERSQLGFADPVAVRRFGTQAWAGHSNHIHVCFPNEDGKAETPRVRRACRDGLLPGRTPSTNTRTLVDGPGLDVDTAASMMGFLAPRCQ